MFILKKGHQPGVYVPLRTLFLVGVEALDDVIEKSGIWPVYCISSAVCLQLMRAKTF